MMRNTLPCGGGGRRKVEPTASSLPRLSAGELRVAHSSLTTVLPVPRLKTCGLSPSMMKMDFPSALWPVTTRRIGFGIRSSCKLSPSLGLHADRRDDTAPALALLLEEGRGFGRR